MIPLKTIFNKDKNILIGAVHFPPLSGYADFPGLDVALQNAIADIRAFEEGGADAIIIENNYDIPHTEFVTAEVGESLTYLAKEISKVTTLPIGISVLWNDYKTALTIAQKTGLKFIRIPVFVDTVETSYGVIAGNPKEVQKFRTEIGAENVAIFTDIHVKHATLLSKLSLEESAQQAIFEGSDALIITGRWTGDAPELNKLKTVRTAAKDFPILCGSGIDAGNVAESFMYANGAIVSTSLKDGAVVKGEVNVKLYSQRISKEKVRELVNNFLEKSHEYSA